MKTELTMTDSVGQVMLSWTVSDLRPSSDVMPGYPVAGKVWEATATVKALRGSVTPAVSQFNAVAPDQAAYRVLWQVASPTNISAATIPQGTQATGKIHFDDLGSLSHCANTGRRTMTSKLSKQRQPRGAVKDVDIAVVGTK